MAESKKINNIRVKEITIKKPVMENVLSKLGLSLEDDLRTLKKAIFRYYNLTEDSSRKTIKGKKIKDLIIKQSYDIGINSKESNQFLKLFDMSEDDCNDVLQKKIVNGILDKSEKESNYFDDTEIFESDSEIDYDNPNPRTEGEKKYAYQRRAERDLKNRKAAIKIHGLRCSACSFDFEKIYGSRGKGYIEVHHKEQLSSFDEAKPVDPTTDLITVCSNCHRMIHRDRNNPLTIEELKEILNKKFLF